MANCFSIATIVILLEVIVVEAWFQSHFGYHPKVEQRYQGPYQNYAYPQKRYVRFSWAYLQSWTIKVED